MKFIGAFKKVPEGGIGFVEELPGVPHPKPAPPHFPIIFDPKNPPIPDKIGMQAPVNPDSDSIPIFSIPSPRAIQF